MRTSMSNGSSLVLHARGGRKGRDAANPDYATALRLLLSRLSRTATRPSWATSNVSAPIAAESSTRVSGG